NVALPTTPTSLPPLTALVNVSSVAVTGAASLTGGATQFSATATLAEGATVPVTTAANWQSSNESVATVSPGGLVTAVGNGTTDLTAAFKGKSGKLTVTVNLLGACVTSVTPSTRNFATIGGSGSVSVTAPAGC